MERVINAISEGVLTHGISNNNLDLYAFEKRAILARKYKERLLLQENEPLPSPWTLEIEPTIICNSRCHFCSYEVMLENHRQDLLNNNHNSDSHIENWLPNKNVFELLDDVKKVGTTKGILFSGGGEPLLWPSIVDASKIASEFADVSIQTNGINLDVFSKRLEDLRSLRLVSVSVLADNKELNKEIARVDNFTRVVENVKELMARKNENRLKITCTAKILVGQRNYQFLPRIIDFWKNKINVDGIGVRLVQDYNYGGIGPRDESVELTNDQKNELVNIIYKDYSNDQFLMNFAQSITFNNMRLIRTTKCFNATDGHFACVDPMGDVYLGNPEIGDERFSIGNLIEQKWSEIWNSERHKNVLTLMDKTEKNEMCPNSLCRHVRANSGIDMYLDDKANIGLEQDIMDNLGAFL